jgi:hypothetical protein
MFATLSGFPPGGQPPPRFLLITAVGFEVEVLLPAEFDAVTRKRTVLPTSADVSVYVPLFAPLIPAQKPPLLSQRIQTTSNLVGPFDQVPLLPVSVEPS